MSCQGALGARRFLRHIHNLGDRGSARLGTRPAQAVSGPDAGKMQPRHNLRRSVGLISAANFPCAIDVDADVGSYAYDARYAAGRDVARNDQTHDCRDLGSREPRQFCLAAEFRDPQTACGPWARTKHPRTTHHGQGTQGRGTHDGYRVVRGSLAWIIGESNYWKIYC